MGSIQQRPHDHPRTRASQRLSDTSRGGESRVHRTSQQYGKSRGREPVKIAAIHKSSLGNSSKLKVRTIGDAGSLAAFQPNSKGGLR
jgi:hypothetical protein